MNIPIDYLNLTNLTVNLTAAIPAQGSLSLGIRDAVWFSLGMMAALLIREVQDLLDGYWKLRKKAKKATK